jgi:opacity protein-like surface antigen
MTMRNPGNGTATVASLVLLAALISSTTQAKVVLESRGPKHHRAPSEHELVLEGGLVQPAGDVGDDFWTTSTGFDAGAGWELGVRVRQFAGRDFSVAPSIHWVTFGAADGVGDFGTGDNLGYRLQTSTVRYGLDMQKYLGEPGGATRPFVTGGLALLHNRYRDELEGSYPFEATVNTPGLSLGAGLRLGNLEFTGEYTWNRFTTGNLDPDGRDLDYNWDYLSVRVGVALGR